MTAQSGGEPGRNYLNVWLAIASVLTLIFIWVLLVDAVPALRGPAPWPPSWRWLYIPLGSANLERLIAHTLLLAGYVIAAAYLLRLSVAKKGWRRWTVVTTAVVFLFFWQLSQTWVREQSLLDTLIFRTYAPPLNGYFLAPAQAESVRAVLLNYAESIPTFFGDRPQTHPPGLFVFYAMFNGLFEQLSGISDAFAPLARSWAIAGRDWPQLPNHLILSAFVTSWLQIILTALAPLSLYAFLKELAGRQREDWVLWAVMAIPLIPPLALFVLQWDTTYPTIGFAAWFFAIRGQNRLRDQGYVGLGCWLDWLWAGLLLSLLTWMSYGNAVYGLLIGLHVLWREALRVPWSQGLRGIWHAARRVLAGLLIMGGGVVAPWILAYMVLGMNFFELWQIGMDNHYQIVTSIRQYQTWIWMNLVDFVFWMGVALLVLGVVGTVWLIRRFREDDELARDVSGMAISFWLVLLLLNFSGSTRGEIGRLWIFLMPFPLMFALIPPWSYRQRLLILVLMALTTWVIGYAIPPFECC